MEFLRNLLKEARTWAQGRVWILRLLMWLWFLNLFWNHLRDRDYQGLLGGLNLGVHEFGHLICMPFGEFIGVAGGSFVQCLVPVISIFMFYRQRDYFAFSFSFVWLGSNLAGVSRYIADARKLELNLVTPFGGGSGEVIHDWNYLLNKMGLLQFEMEIAAAVRISALICLLGGIFWGAWILWLMIKSKRGGPWDGLNKLEI